MAKTPELPLQAKGASERSLASRSDAAAEMPYPTAAAGGIDDQPCPPEWLPPKRTYEETRIRQAAAAGGARLLRMAFRLVLGPRLREGRLDLAFPDGNVESFGEGASPHVGIAIRDLTWCLRIILDPELAVGEAYMDGALTIERGDLSDLAELLSKNGRYRNPHKVARWRRLFDDKLHHLNQHNVSRSNVAHHYDLTLDFYRLFLDDDLQYSCAYFCQPGMSLEDAQRAKKKRIIRKLLVEPGQRVLDIGCGWGGLALDLAQCVGVEVDAITLSIEQRLETFARVGRAGLARRVHVEIRDYRDVRMLYDRIVSVGMFEHVGRPNYLEFFRQIERHLRDDGVALVHTIGRSEGPGVSQKWVERHIFPGGYIPALSEMVAAIEKSGLIVTDVEVLRLHYAETLQHWLKRFRANTSSITKLYGERFCRMWEFYLSFSESAFRYDGLCVFQIQLAKRAGIVPITRDYMREVGTVDRMGDVAINSRQGDARRYAGSTDVDRESTQRADKQEVGEPAARRLARG